MHDHVFDNGKSFVCSSTWRRVARHVLVAVALAAGLRAAPALAADATLTSLGAGLYNTVIGTTGGPTETFSFAGSFHITIDGGAPRTPFASTSTTH